MRDLLGSLHDWLARGGCAMGELVIERFSGGYTLCHHDDSSAPDLTLHLGPEAALELANFDDAGNFRPLKTAPNLRHGWKLQVADLEELRRALDYFYPAMLGVWHSYRDGALRPVPLRETLERQSGMYRVTRQVTDEQAQQVIGSLCASDGGCLKHLLWPIAPDLPIAMLPLEKLQAPDPLPSLPLLCHEGCNLLVAKIREVVKTSPAHP